VGNAILGLTLDGRGVFTGGLRDLLGPYPLLVGALAASLFAMHGAIFLYLKTEGAVQERLGRWMWHTWGLFLVLYLLVTMWTMAAVPGALANFRHFPWAAAVVVLNVLAIANVPRALFLGKYGQAFLSTSLTIACMVFLFGMAMFPNLVVARNDPALSLTIYNAASSAKTLRIGLLIAAIGMPFVLTYTSVIYWTFRGKVVLGDHSY
jgi:cytochrome d ubiquinol oxidase subunit II